MIAFRRSADAPLVLGLALLLLVSPVGSMPAFRPHAGLLAFVQTTAPPGSWALGLVVPQGATLADGRTVAWGNVGNITAVVELPVVSRTDNTILVVLSAMVGDNSVLQVSAGLFPESTSWRAVGWYIPDVRASPQQYEWTLNSSTPELPSGGWVSLSIFQAGGVWQYRIVDLDTQREVSGAYSDAPVAHVREGDQEVFALESYTSNATVISGMGNLTLKSLYLDGQALKGGLYYYNDWDPSHQPLFVVGGLDAPNFISVEDLRNGTFVWSYSAQWRDVTSMTSEAAYAAMFTLIVTLAVILLYIAIHMKPRSLISSKPH